MSAIALPKGDMDWKAADVTGDFGNGLEAISLCDFGSSDLFAGNWPHGVLGVLQHYLPKADIFAGALFFFEAGALHDFLPDWNFTDHARMQVFGTFIFHHKAGVEHFGLGVGFLQDGLSFFG